MPKMKYYDESTSQWVALDAKNADALSDGINTITPQNIVAIDNKIESHSGDANIHFTSTERNKLSGISDNANNYILPNATTSTIGGVKVGTNLTVTSGTVSVANASTTVKGVVQLNDTLTSTSTALAVTANQAKVLKDLVDTKASNADLTSLSNEVTQHSNDNAQRMINVKFPPSPLVAAVGNGVVDDAPAIQAIINYVSDNGGGTVFLPKGNYRIESTLFYKKGVSIKGESGLFNTRLTWASGTNGFILNMTNIDLNLCSIENICFNTTSSKNGSGIRAGSTFVNYNAFNMRFKDLLFFNLDIGFYGVGIDESIDVRAIGVFDSYFENIWCSDCNTGLWLGGSGNTVINPRLTGCGNGVTLDYASPESASSVQVLGGVFAANKGYDLYINDARGLRNSTFIGTWFEDATNGIINIPYANTFLSSLLFINCQLHSKATQFGLLNFHNATGAIKLDNCVITQSLSNQDISVVPPSNLANGTILKVSNTLKITHENIKSVLNYSIYDHWNLVPLINGWAQVGDLTRYFKTDDNVVHLQIGMKDGTPAEGTIIGILPEGCRPSASTRFQVFDGTARVTRQMFIGADGGIAIQAETGKTASTGVWAGYITFKAR